MAYNAAKVILAEAEGDGRLHLDIEYSGNAGEPVCVKPYYVQSSTAPPNYLIRAEAMNQIAILNQTRALAASIWQTMPFTLDVTTPVTLPAANVSVTYMAATLPFTPGATPRDVFTLTGSPSRNVTVIGAGIATQQTTAGVNYWNLLRRSTANSGGTSAAVAAVKHDNALADASAIARQYTANPTDGTLVGRIWSGRVSSPAPATSGVGNTNVVVDLERRTIKLAGVNDVIAFNFNGAALPAGLSVSAWFAWVES